MALLVLCACLGPSHQPVLRVRRYLVAHKHILDANQSAVCVEPTFQRPFEIIRCYGPRCGPWIR